MGKGRITSGGSGGNYLVKVLYDRTQLDKVKQHIQQNIDVLTILYAAEVKDLVKKNIYKLKIKSCEKQLEYLETYVPKDEIRQAWCADLTEDLTGEVGTIEVPGELKSLQIRPGFSNTQAYDETRDGQLSPTATLSPAGAFYNLAMLPGWQKWKPLFRYATIDSINGNAADITLELTHSSQQDLYINQTDTLSDVPIEYMDCHGAAFSTGDEVLVSFTGQDWAQPKIIGFKDNPKPCGELLIVYIQFTYGTGILDPSCFVWDFESNSYATGILDDDTGEEVSFPCLKSRINNFINSKSPKPSSAALDKLVYIQGAVDATPVILDSDWTKTYVSGTGCYVSGQQRCQLWEADKTKNTNYSSYNHTGPITANAFASRQETQKLYRGELAKDLNVITYEYSGAYPTTKYALYTSRTPLGGVKAKATKAEWSYKDDFANCADEVNYPVWPCTDMLVYRDNLESSIDYTYTSPFTGFETLEYNITLLQVDEASYTSTPFGARTVSYIHDYDEVTDLTFTTVDLKTDKAVLIFDTMDVRITKSYKTASWQTLTKTYRSEKPEKILAYYEKNETSSDNINPFAIPVNLPLSDAVTALHTFALNLSGDYPLSPSNVKEKNRYYSLIPQII